MSLWQRLMLTVLAMLAVSFVAGLLWGQMFDARLPSFLGGIVGGLTAIPVWEVLKRLK